MRALVIAFNREDWSELGTKAPIQIWNPHESIPEAVDDLRNLEENAKNFICFGFISID